MPASMRRLAIPLTLLALLVAACGGDDGGGGGGASSEACPSGSVEIKMVDIKFDPEDATAGVGQEVCWVNEDSIDHNAVAESGATFESELFGKGETFTTKVDQPGAIGYVCTIHPGMTGTLTVER
ncbi:MAG TPA: plastocyanin/azurin family copper-binding protein [Solirubrobacteraceae bacterium]|nr:plastocyanin/azurin family copper-binding protein [Solirubrobacteraceae bacterium]